MERGQNPFGIGEIDPSRPVVSTVEVLIVETGGVSVYNDQKVNCSSIGSSSFYYY